MKVRVYLGLAAVAAGAMLLAGCRTTPPEEPSAEVQTRETGTAETGGSARTDTLWMDFTAGSNVEDIRPVALETSVTAEELCAALEQVTGIRFDFTLSADGAGYTVAWQSDSAMLQGETPQDEHQDYVFYDDDLLRWFMLDTVWRNLTEEFGAGQVLYTGPDGAPLQLEDPWPLGGFDLSEPYRGSAWYCEQSEAWDLEGLPSA